MLSEYSVPKYFQEDFFELLEDRPSYRWILVGPTRAGRHKIISLNDRRGNVSQRPQLDISLEWVDPWT